MTSEIEIIPGNPGRPLFTPAEYEAFRDRYIADVGPEMERHRITRARSEHAFFFGHRFPQNQTNNHTP